MVRLVQLLVQVEQLKFSFLVCSAWRKSKTSRKKFCKEGAKRTRWRFFEWGSQKILPVPFGTFNPIYRVRRERLLKV
ncbi:hypothetical protein BKK42_08945 [Bacillus cereus]|nr:hypothetical protein CK938_28285 [Bacillus cereus]ESU04048.1 hypothetical protein M461_0205440 [Staphylococcus epidermidis CIM37]NHA32220.1 hypothetical protein [Bacillus paranthracis]OUB91659.1 hypothetical protein BK752_31000 [Bacillus thuringiensis serovar canadensis]BAL21543.1 hypothetical protein BCN_C2_04 [Bacillus cereus NC7401]